MRATASSRRNFLRGKFNRLDKAIMRPPHASDQFESLCNQCSDCVSACPEAIIIRDEDRRPVVDLRLGECTFCGACAEACPTGALDPDLPLDWPWQAQISEACLAQQGISCRACEDVCDPQAIKFRLQLGGRSQPVIDLGQCTGCGACAHTCPAQAVSFQRKQPASPEGVE
ncbi:ferredoxin-type protein NapF [Pseudooceanicola sp.]|uniref:ferredoxin-type protein NapF n=1 Tax=Pseudooceanicola sp. TaxID=1914328 RepID=UPI0035C6EE87